MKPKYLILFVLLAFIFSACKKHSNSEDIKQLHILLDQKDYFRLDTRFKAVSNDIDDEDRLYFKSFIDNAYNRNTECIMDVDSLFAEKDLKLTDSARYTLKSIQGDSYFKTFQYAKAAACDSDIIKNYKL